MAVLPTNSTCLELTISVPGLNSSSSLPSSVKGLDINQIPSSGVDQEEWTINDESNYNGGSPPRKKLRLTKEQSRLLEEGFRLNQTLNHKEKEALAMQLNLKARQVEVWFQNRRARSKLKQTEMECEYLKRWFGSLTEQNRRLQKEVEELRAMKVGSSSVVSHHTTMCPCCERITTTTLDNGSTKTTTNNRPHHLVV
ncbi:homeobox-leucine zipper protein ATHB-17-like [Cornus florida]|uniref:homeobox-leucine zipper protein ATHB-17-like n=1 Tax=Cornus florida TaxID=4283 RepID=UPI002898A1ED|nr:homeobox-leucine zipper protein ATHB-17-like [Cornus florida]